MRFSVLAVFASMLVPSLFAGEVSLQLDASKPGVPIKTDGFLGADLGIWNSPERFELSVPSLTDAGFAWFRFPDGSLSNDYHWNGSGSYDSLNVWTPDSVLWSSGFLGEAAFRGTSKNNWGFARRSNMLDGDSSTFWWGAVYDSTDVPLVVVDFGHSVAVDSLYLVWGKLSPKAFELAFWTDTSFFYPAPHQGITDKFKSVMSKKVSGRISAEKFKPVTARYVAIRFKLKDLQKAGVELAELGVFSSGMNVVNNAEAKLFATSTHNGDFRRTDWTGIRWDFDAFMNYIERFPNAKPVICVNAGTGSAKEAALWVRYANKVKKYGIKAWQIGNELDGEWEETGPLSARQYAAKYLEFARAMLAEDSALEFYGPLYSSHEFWLKGSGMLDGSFWMEEFLRVVAAAEKRDGRRYISVVDMHSYPYWAPNNLNEANMLLESKELRAGVDTLKKWMDRYLGGDRGFALSEFSTTVVCSDVTMQASQAAALANIMAQAAFTFPDRFYLLPWDVFGGICKGPDGTSGSMTLNLLKRNGSWDLWDGFSPSAEYFGIYLASKWWLASGFSFASAVLSDTSVAAYPLVRGDSLKLLLVNFAGNSNKVNLELPKNLRGRVAEVFHFSKKDYTWVGNDASAFAYPGMGPEGEWISKSDSLLPVEMPPFSVAVLLVNPALNAARPPHFIQASLAKSPVLEGDSLDLSFTVAQDAGRIVSVSVASKLLNYFKDVLPVDGSLGAGIENFHLKIAVPKMKPADGDLKISVKGLNKKSADLVIPFHVRGNYRTFEVFQDYENESSVNWYPVANGNNATSMSGKVFKGSGKSGAYMRHDFVIEQPKEQSWPNFSAAHYELAGTGIAKSVGIVFDYATSHSSESGYIELLVQSSQVKDYDDFHYLMKNTHGNWVRDTVLWSAIAQEGWGKAIRSLDPKQIRTFAFRGRGEGKGFISLDNIYLLGEDGKEIPMPNELRRLR
ncbi:MAG: glycoside hydrolase family 44 protein [Fibrobacteraceae bacterium]